MADKENVLHNVTIVNCRAAEGPPIQDMIGRVEKKPGAKWHKILSWNGSIIFLRPYGSRGLVNN